MDIKCIDSVISGEYCTDPGSAVSKVYSVNGTMLRNGAMLKVTTYDSLSNRDEDVTDFYLSWLDGFTVQANFAQNNAFFKAQSLFSDGEFRMSGSWNIKKDSTIYSVCCWSSGTEGLTLNIDTIHNGQETILNGSVRDNSLTLAFNSPVWQLSCDLNSSGLDFILSSSAFTASCLANDAGLELKLAGGALSVTALWHLNGMKVIRS